MAVGAMAKGVIDPALVGGERPLSLACDASVDTPKWAPPRPEASTPSEYTSTVV